MTRTTGAVMVAAVAGIAAVVAYGRPPAATPVADPPAKFAETQAGGAEPKVKAIPFDGDKAMAHLKDLIAIGPRVSGSAGMAKQIELLDAHFTKHGGKVAKQAFQAKQYSRKEKVGMTNLVVSYFPDRAKRVMLCTHYDTRPMAHEEPDRAAWNKPFDSANDGTSGVAFFMEFARHMADFPTAFGVDFVFFDGEEYIFEPAGAFGGGDRFFFGSDHFADEYKKSTAARKWKYEAAVLFDLFAHPGAVFRVEGNSFEFAPVLTKQVWDVAAAVGVKSFEYKQGPTVSDDHLALNRVGIPAVDVIDFDGYKPHWHKLSDTADKCAAGPLNDMFKVMSAWLQLIR